MGDIAFLFFRVRTGIKVPRTAINEPDQFALAVGLGLCEYALEVCPHSIFRHLELLTSIFHRCPRASIAAKRASAGVRP